jgi:hypothetical protein
MSTPIPKAAPTPKNAAAAVIAAASAIALIGGLPFFVATTFTGDDHLFLAFSRYAPNPLTAFVRDQHGGEFYRPLPMLLWWVLGRWAEGSTWPFSSMAWLLHLTVALEIGALMRAARQGLRVAAIASALFFISPFTREAAYWYAASTDLLATGLGVGAIVALLRGRSWVAGVLYGAACWSKESAIVVPVLAAVMLRAQNRDADPATSWSVVTRRVAWLLPVAAAYLVVRTIVLHGAGGSGDVPASLPGKALQIAAGLALAAVGSERLDQPIAWTIGIASWVALLFGCVRRARTTGGPPFPWEPFAWVALATAPLLVVPWIVGARYFYVAAVGIAWLAAQVLSRASIIVVVGVFCGMAGVDFAQTLGRHADVSAYERRLSAARRAVTAGLAQGYTTFHISSGIKDLDLAVKEAPEISRIESALVVLSDVPASFVVLPRAHAREFDFLLARPPLPPSGAYRFGEREIVGLARRGDDPALDEVIARLPAIRFIRLRLGPGGRVIPRDVTDTGDGLDSDHP